jgi:flagellar biogenesis protein FliO
MEMATSVMVGPAAARLENESLAVRLLAWLRRVARGRAADAEAPLRAEARMSLGPKKSLVLVNCCGRRVLLGLSGDAIVPLGEVELPRRGAKSGTRSRAKVVS